MVENELKKYCVLRNGDVFLFMGQQFEENDIVCEMRIWNGVTNPNLLYVHTNLVDCVEFGETPFCTPGLTYSLLPVKKEIIENLKVKSAGTEGLSK